MALDMFAKTSSIIAAPPSRGSVPEAEVDLGKCSLLFQNTGVAQAVVSINGSILVFILGGFHPPLWALAWLAAVYAVAAFRYGLSRQFLRSAPLPRDAIGWQRRAIRWTGIAGLVWAVGAVALMVVDPDATRMFTALVIAGMVSGAVPILSSVPRAFRTYAIPVMLAIILTASIDNHGVRDWMLATVATLYLFALLKSAHYFHDTLDNSIRLALDMRYMAEDLEQARRDAEASSNAKSQFLAMMSHEVRTPLNGILGMAQALLNPGLAQEQRQDYAGTILASGQTLLMLLNDVLDFSKVEAGKLELNLVDCDLHRVIADTASLFAESAQSKNLRIETACDSPGGARYRADANRLRQMLSNLVNNAVKFTSAGHIRIEARELSRENGRALLELSVSDSGIGIPAGQQPMLFQPFVQVDNSDTREFGGTGLGLSIVRLLAELMGGEVGVESAPGRGSRFWFRVRADVLTTSAEAAVDAIDDTSMAVPAAAEIKRVLVVEDNAVNRKVVGAMLEKPGIRVDYVENGQIAVDCVTQGSPIDLILMDCQMPVMDGYAATRAIRGWEKEAGRPHIPIVALTASAFEDDRNRCLAAGMDDFLPKPVSLPQLNATLGKWLFRPRREVD